MFTDESPGPSPKARRAHFAAITGKPSLSHLCCRLGNCAPSSTPKSMSNRILGFSSAWQMPLAFGSVSIPKLYFNTLRIIFLPFLEKSIFRIHVLWQEYMCRPQRGNDILNSEIRKKKKAYLSELMAMFFYSNDHRFLSIPGRYLASWTCFLFFIFSLLRYNRQTKILYILSLQLDVLIYIHIVK